jgi:hypothetical protein
MPATTNNISVEQNVPYSFIIYVQDSSGNPVNVSSGYTFSCKVRPDYQASPLVTLSLGNGVSVASTTPWGVTISFTSAQTLSFPVTTTTTTLSYDVLMTQTSGSFNTMLARGTISVVGAITR